MYRDSELTKLSVILQMEQDIVVDKGRQLTMGRELKRTYERRSCFCVLIEAKVVEPNVIDINEYDVRVLCRILMDAKIKNGECALHGRRTKRTLTKY